MLVYDICNEKSFENIKNWIRNIEEVCAKKKILLLHGGEIAAEQWKFPPE